MDALANKLREQARAEGFDACQICAPDAVPDVPARLDAFLEKGYHGQMGWLAERTHWRGNPAALWPEARSVIMLAVSYTPEEDPLEALTRKEAGTVSVMPKTRIITTSSKKG